MSKKRTIHGIDPYAPGGLDALFAHHRALFGDAVMEAGEGGEPASDPAPADPAPVGDPAPAPEPAGAPEAKPEPQKVEDLPGWAQKIIEDARKDAGDERVATKTLAAIQKALNPDAKGNEKPTADQLTKALTDRETEAREAKQELAVYKRATANGADADALLDSRGFLAKLGDIDPSDTKALDKAIKDAVTDNPKLAAVRAAAASGGDFSGGSSEKPAKATSIESAVAARYGA